MRLYWREVITTGVRPGVVVVVHGIVNCGLCLFKRVEGLIQLPFLFEYSVDAFSQCIFVGVAILGHADPAFVCEQDVDVCLGAVLDSSIRMVHQLAFGVLALGQGLLQGTYTKGRAQGLAELVADDLSGVGIRDQHQVTEFAADANVGNIAYPKLFGSFDGHACCQIGVFFEPMPAVCGCSVFFAAPDEQIISAQQGEKLVAPQMNAVLLPRLLQHVQQLAPAHTWGILSLTAHQVNHQSLIEGLLISAPLVIVEGLTAFSQQPTQLA